MLSFQSELEQLRPTLGDPRTDALLARDRREVFSLYPELRIAAWAGAMLLATAAGIVLQKNLERIGPIALATLIAIAAVACYAWVWWRRARASLADDYVLLLGALLVSADVAFIEAQFHWLDRQWPRHFLILFVVHAVGAYAYRSRMLLSLSIAALAAWLGIERRTLDFTVDLAPRAFLCSALVIGWREIHRRLSDLGAPPDFLGVFEHFAANLALWGGLTLLSEDETFTIGCIVTIVIALAVMGWGFAKRIESFVLYAFLYAVFAADALLVRHVHGSTAVSLVVFISMVIAIATLAVIHRRFDER